MLNLTKSVTREAIIERVRAAARRYEARGGDLAQGAQDVADEIAADDAALRAVWQAVGGEMLHRLALAP